MAASARAVELGIGLRIQPRSRIAEPFPVRADLGSRLDSSGETPAPIQYYIAGHCFVSGGGAGNRSRKTQSLEAWCLTR